MKEPAQKQQNAKIEAKHDSKAAANKEPLSHSGSSEHLDSSAKHSPALSSAYQLKQVITGGDYLKQVQMKKAATTSASGIPAHVQAKMEGSFGTDFSDVKVHSNSAEAKSLGAQAFTDGSHIHFAQGKFNPESKSGQELLGHELTHVVQQRAGNIKPNTNVMGVPVNNDQGLESQADQMGAKAANGQRVQMKAASASGVLSSKGIQAKTIQRKVLQFNPNQGAPVAIVSKSVMVTEVCQTRKVPVGGATTSDAIEKCSKGAKYKEMDTITVENPVLGEDWYKIKGTNEYIRASKVVIKEEGGVRGKVSGQASEFNTLKTIASTITSGGDKEKAEKSSGGEKLNDAADTTLDLAGMAGDATDSLKNFDVKDVSEAESQLALFGGISGIAKALKKGVGVIINVIKLIKGAESSEEKQALIYDVVTGGIETVQGVFEAVDGFISLGGGAADWIGSAVIPGIDIVLSGFELVKSGVYAIKSWINMREMEKERLAVLASAGGSPQQQNLQNNASKFRVQNAVTGNLVGRKDDLQDKEDSGQVSRKSVDYDDQIVAVNSMINKSNALSNQQTTGANKTSFKYMLADDLVRDNKKRVIRQAIHIGTALANIAGSITIIATGATGVGAAVGASIKIAAGGVELGVKAARGIKFTHRDKRAKEATKEMTSQVYKSKSTAQEQVESAAGTKETDSANKSSYAKAYQRYSKARFILTDMIKPLAALDPAADKNKPQYSEVLRYVKATSASLKTLAAQPNDKTKATYLAKSMGQREMFG